MEHTVRVTRDAIQDTPRTTDFVKIQAGSAWRPDTTEAAQMALDALAATRLALDPGDRIEFDVVKGTDERRITYGVVALDPRDVITPYGSLRTLADQLTTGRDSAPDQGGPMNPIRLQDGSEISLLEVERDDDLAVIGTTNTGKRFVTRPDRKAKDIPAGRHPYRVYLVNGVALRAVDPEFGEAEAWFLGDHDPATAEFLNADGVPVEVSRDDVLSLLSATPEDQAQAEAGANGVGEQRDTEATEVEAS